MWDSVAHSLGGLCASLVLVVSPERIVLSGGVMNRTSLYPKVRLEEEGVCYGASRHSSICRTFDIIAHRRRRFDLTRRLRPEQCELAILFFVFRMPDA